ncbi:MAG: DMT family transporter [Burkholderiaceae bacterium]|nr:DMT family transporter [Burkholderiaceae bacterium]
MSTVAATPPFAANRRGILSMAGAMACFVANDTVVKVVSAGMPTAQLIFLRGVIATAMVLAVAHALGATARLRDTADRRVLARAAAEAIATVLYLTALFQLPIANATAINLSAPLFIVVLAVMFMREKVSAAHWLAVCAGFAGVVLVVQPGLAGFNVYALVCLLSALFQAVRDLLTRRIAGDVPSVLVTLSTTASVTALAAPLSLLEGWRAFGAGDLGLLALAAVFLMGAYYLIVDAMRHGRMSLVAPFRYTGVLYAIVVGYLVWGDVPNPLAWGGIALLIGAGLYVLYRERRAPGRERRMRQPGSGVGVRPKAARSPDR